MVTDSVTDMTTRYNVISWIWEFRTEKGHHEKPNEI